MGLSDIFPILNFCVFYLKKADNSEIGIRDRDVQSMPFFEYWCWVKRQSVKSCGVIDSRHTLCCYVLYIDLNVSY